jgi:hypothetical protein
MTHRVGLWAGRNRDCALDDWRDEVPAGFEDFTRDCTLILDHLHVPFVDALEGHHPADHRDEKDQYESDCGDGLCESAGIEWRATAHISIYHQNYPSIIPLIY